jgi:predicted Zn-dependent peptidase
MPKLLVDEELHAILDKLLRGYPTKVNAVTSEKAAAIADKYFQPENIFLIAVGGKNEN